MSDESIYTYTTDTCYAEDCCYDRDDYNVEDEDEWIEEQIDFYKKSISRFKRELRLRKENKHLHSYRLWNNKPIRDMTDKHLENAINYCKKRINELFLDSLANDLEEDEE